MNELRSYRKPRFFFFLGLLTIGQTVLRPALGFTLSDWFFLLSFLLALSESLLKSDLKIKFPHLLFFGLLFFAIGGVISSGHAQDPIVSIIALLKYLYLMAVWFWLGTVLLQTPKQIQTAIVLWTSSAALSGLGALMQVVWEDIIPGTSPAWSRMTGLTEHVNDLGGLTSIALIPAMIMIGLSTGKKRQLIRSWICVALITGGLVLSVSMSGVLALLASFSVWIVLSRLSPKKIAIIFVAFALFVGAIFIQSYFERVSILSRLYDISDDGLHSITLQTRIQTFNAAWEAIKESPLVGVGLGPNSGETKTGYVVHNIFLLNWFESGLFGLLGMIMILLSIFSLSYKGITDQRRKQDQTLGTALFSSFVAFIVMGMAQPIYYKRFGWISAALLIALYKNDPFSNIWQRTSTLQGHRQRIKMKSTVQ